MLSVTLYNYAKLYIIFVICWNIWRVLVSRPVLQGSEWKKVAGGHVKLKSLWYVILHKTIPLVVTSGLSYQVYLGGMCSAVTPPQLHRTGGNTQRYQQTISERQVRYVCLSYFSREKTVSWCRNSSGIQSGGSQFEALEALWWWTPLPSYLQM